MVLSDNKGRNFDLQWETNLLPVKHLLVFIWFICYIDPMSDLTDITWEKARELPLSTRVVGLYERFFARYDTLGRRIFWEAEEVSSRNDALCAAYRDTTGLAPIRRRAPGSTG